MTLPLRRKRPTTLLARKSPARTAASLLLVGLWLAAGTAPAQYTPAVAQPVRMAPPTLDAAVTSTPRTVPPAAPAWIDPQVRQAQASRFATRVDDFQVFDVRFDLPGPEMLFRMDSEADLIQRMKQERRRIKREEL